MATTEKQQRKQNILSFRSREHNPGHLQEDLQNISREATVSIKGREGPFIPASPFLAQLLVTPLCKALMLSSAPKPSVRAEGAPLSLEGLDGHVCGYDNPASFGSCIHDMRLLLLPAWGHTRVGLW